MQEREQVETALTREARLHPPSTVKRQGQKLLACLEQDGTDPGDERERAEPANTMTYHRSRTGRVRIVAELAEVFEGMILPLFKPKQLTDPDWTTTTIKGLPHFIPPRWVDRARQPLPNILPP